MKTIKYVNYEQALQKIEDYCQPFYDDNLGHVVNGLTLSKVSQALDESTAIIETPYDSDFEVIIHACPNCGSRFIGTPAPPYEYCPYCGCKLS